MPNGEHSEYVTWRGFVALGLPIIGIPVVVTWVLLTSHSSGTHSQAVRYKDLVAIEQEIVDMANDVREIKLLLLRHGMTSTSLSDKELSELPE